jgi:hypothetical protein
MFRPTIERADRPDWAPGAQYVGGYRAFTKGGVKSDHQYLTPAAVRGLSWSPSDRLMRK